MPGFGCKKSSVQFARLALSRDPIQTPPLALGAFITPDLLHLIYYIWKSRLAPNTGRQVTCVERLGDTRAAARISRRAAI
jgi:hypothetical protein